MKGGSNLYRVGDLRPSQILFSFGVGSLVDLPNMSVMVMGIDDWDIHHMTPINEDRLLAAVKRVFIHQDMRRGALLILDIRQPSGIITQIHHRQQMQRIQGNALVVVTEGMGQGTCLEQPPVNIPLGFLAGGDDIAALPRNTGTTAQPGEP